VADLYGGQPAGPDGAKRRRCGGTATHTCEMAKLAELPLTKAVSAADIHAREPAGPDSTEGLRCGGTTAQAHKEAILAREQ
jgi:hypothetical protein